MLNVLDFLLFASFVVLLGSLIMQNDKNNISFLKVQAYSCIVALVVEVVSLVIRFLLSEYWFPVLVVLIIHTIISIGIINAANNCGVFERKKKGSNNGNIDVVV